MTTAVNFTMDHHDTDIVLSLLQKLRGRHIDRVHAHARADKPMPPKMPPVECTPWCEDRDGHPDCFGREDQGCWSPSTYVDLSLESVDTEGDAVFPQRIGAMARRLPDAEGFVHLHLDNIKLYGPIPYPYDHLDHGLDLTVDEARVLADALRDAADLIAALPQVGNQTTE